MDTVNYRCTGHLKSELLVQFRNTCRFRSNGWDFERRWRGGYTEPSVVELFSAYRKTPFIHVFGEGNFLKGLTCHLPEVLHGFNGIQIKSAEEFAQAQQRLIAFVSELTRGPVILGECVRFDYAYNLRCAPAEVLGALRHVNHPRIRKDKAFYRNGNVQLMGSKFSVSFYQKGKTRNNKVGMPYDQPINPKATVLRVEVQAKNKQAVEELYGTTNSIGFDHAWKCFRSFLLELPRCEALDQKYTPTGVVALAEANGVKLPNGVSVLDWYLEGKSPDTTRKARKKVIKQVFGIKAIDFEQLLPVEAPKFFVDVYPDGTEHEVSALDSRILV